MTTIEESRLRFRFDDSWHAIKYDGHPDHEKIKRLHGTKAVDFVAVRGGQALFIEVKNCSRGYRIETRQESSCSVARIKNLTSRPKWHCKVRDSITGIVAACHGSAAEDWRPVVACLVKSEPSVKVLLWLEQDLPRDPPGRRSNQKQTLNRTLKERLSRALTTKSLS